MPSNLKGFFFYQFISRKDLLNKFIFLSPSFVPNLQKVSILKMSDQKVSRVTNFDLFSWICLFELLFGIKFDLHKCDFVNLSNLSMLQNFRLSSSCVIPTSYELFYRIFFLWFQGFTFPNQEYNKLQKIMTNKVSDKMVALSSKRKNVIKVVYIKYNEPFLKKNNSGNKNIVGLWSDFTFCSFIPVKISDNCATFSFTFLFEFSTKISLYKKLMLSSLKILHRFSEKIKLI